MLPAQGKKKHKKHKHYKKHSGSSSSSSSSSSSDDEKKKWKKEQKKLKKKMKKDKHMHVRGMSPNIVWLNVYIVHTLVVGLLQCSSIKHLDCGQIC